MSKQPIRNHYINVSRGLRVLAHPCRLSILDALRRGPCCVDTLCHLLDKPQPYISQQLGILREAGVVACERRHTYLCYRVIDPMALDILTLLLGPIADQGVMVHQACEDVAGFADMPRF